MWNLKFWRKFTKKSVYHGRWKVNQIFCAEKLKKTKFENLKKFRENPVKMRKPDRYPEN